MSTPRDPRQNHGGTYFVPDRNNGEELTRLQLQDQMLTVSMGGPLPEQPDLRRVRRVLDVGCGTGGWLIEVARIAPALSHGVGIDVNPQMLAYARTQAQAHHVSDRVEFRLMDALQMLEFPADSFDLVNQRFAQSWLRTWDWPKLLSEYRRVTCPGGVIRITESDILTHSTSPALIRLWERFLDALYQAGHFFAHTSDGVTSHLAGLLHQYGFQQVQTQSHTLHYCAGTVEGDHFAEDMRLVFRVVMPSLRKWSQLPEDYEALYQQMLAEMAQPNFVVSWTLSTAWGIKPLKRTKIAVPHEI